MSGQGSRLLENGNGLTWMLDLVKEVETVNCEL